MPKTQTKSRELSLLERRIEEWNLPRSPYQPAFDRIVVVPVPEDKSVRETFLKAGTIIMPGRKREVEANETARGVVVAAGLGALDVLRSHGMDVGHLVWVARLSPWRHVVERNEKTGGDIEMLFMRVGDIVGSEDTLEAVTAGAFNIIYDTKQEKHVYDGAGPRVDPPDYVA